jgi:DNA-binding NarL/FixJ family response regulator
MLCDIIADVVTREPDMKVVGRLPSREGLRSTVAKTGADLVVLGLDDSGLPEDCRQLFHSQPRIRVLGVATDGRRGVLYELRPVEASLGELSPERLVEAIRTGDPTGVQPMKRDRAGRQPAPHHRG